MRVLLVVYDNESYVHHTPIGMAYLATALENMGHDVEIYSQDLYHWPESHLTEYLDKNAFDVIGLGIVAGYYPFRKMLKISAAINASRNRPVYVMGGHGPSPEPEYFLKKSKADFIVIGEGEVTIIDLLTALEYKQDLSKVRGIAYLDNDKFVQTPPMPLIQDINTIPIPDWRLFPMDYYAMYRVGNILNSTDRVGLVLSGRGCPFHCNFCYRMEAGSRIRSPENILEETGRLQKDFNLNFFLFQDELLMTSVERTEKLCHAFKGKFRWGCNGRLNFATPSLMKLMKESGCEFINYGIESVDDEALRNMNKALTVKQIYRGIETTLDAGIHPGFNIIFGNIGETKEILQKDVDFLLKYDEQGQMRTIRPVTPYPGTPLYEYAIKNGMIRDAEDFYEHRHTNQDLPCVNFTNLSDEEYRHALCEANTTLLNNYFEKQKQRSKETCEKLYLGNNTDFRGFRQT